MRTIIDHPLYSVYEYPEDNASVYDWVASSGRDSDELFESAEEAEDDVRAKIGLTSDIVVLTKAEYDELLEYKFRYEGLDK